MSVAGGNLGKVIADFGKTYGGPSFCLENPNPLLSAYSLKP